jgi:Zn-dependent protease with chaperone function
VKTNWGGGLERARARFAERVSARLFTEVTERPLTKPGRDAASLAAAAIAAVVHLLTFALAALGVLIVVWANSAFPLIPIVAAAALVGLAWLMRPRLGKPPKLDETVDPDTAPALYALVNKVAERVGARPVWRIVLSPEFNASYTVLGWRRRAVLVIGYPVWNILEPQERLALLGHELGHGVNGDSRRGLLVGSSLGSLGELSRTLVSRGASTDGEGLLVMVSAAAAQVMLRVLSLPVIGLGMLQERLLAQSGQRAEYYADHLSAEVAGAAHAVGSLGKIRLASGSMISLRAATIRRESDIWAAQREWLRGRTAEDHARVVAAEEAEPHRVDASHPPTGLRMRAVRSRVYGGDVLVSNTAEMAVVDRELQPYLRDLAQAYRG